MTHFLVHMLHISLLLSHLNVMTLYDIDTQVMVLIVGETLFKYTGAIFRIGGHNLTTKHKEVPV